VFLVIAGGLLLWDSGWRGKRANKIATVKAAGSE